MNKVATFFQKIILLISLIFPITISVICCIVLTFFGWERLGWGRHTYEYFLIPPLNDLLLWIVFVIVSVSYLLLSSTVLFKFCKRKNAIGSYIYVYLAALFVRLFFFAFTKNTTAPFSDFAQTWGIANGVMSSFEYKSLFATWMNFAGLERAFIKIFGNKYLIFLFLNCLVSSSSAAVVMGIVNTALSDQEQRKEYGLVAGLLYAVYPASAVFSLISAPDIYVVPLYLLGILFLLFTEERRIVGSYKAIVFSIVAGVFIGLSSTLKSFGVVIIIAYLIVGLLETLQKFREPDRIKKFVILFLCVLCLGGSYKIVKDGILLQTEQTFSTELDYSVATPHYLLVGLNTEGEGQIHIGTKSRNYYQNILERGMSVTASKEFAYKLLRDDLTQNFDKILPLFLKKIIWAWQDDVIPAYYYRNSIIQTPVSIIEKVLFRSVAPLSQIFYLLVVFSAIIGVIFILREFGSNQGIVFINLIIVGYFFMMLLSEAQSRYKYLIMPLLCVVATIGIVCTYLKIKPHVMIKWAKRNDY